MPCCVIMKTTVERDSTALTISQRSSKACIPGTVQRSLRESKHPGDSANPLAQECEWRSHVPSQELMTKDRHSRPVAPSGECCHCDSGSLSGKDKNGPACIGQEVPFSVTAHSVATPRPGRERTHKKHNNTCLQQRLPPSSLPYSKTHFLFS